MMAKRNYLWASLPCPSCGADKPKLEILYGFLFRPIDLKKYVPNGGSFIGNEPGIECRQCREGDLEEEDDYFAKRQDVVKPDNPEWDIKNLGSGMYVRYMRTIALRSSPVTGTGGYRYGVDIHAQIHCKKCCCVKAVNSRGHKPAGGNFTVAGIGGYPWIWERWARSASRYHLKDPVRHPYKRSKIILIYRKIRVFSWNLKRRVIKTLTLSDFR